MATKVFPLKLKDSHKEQVKDIYFEHETKIYKTLGFKTQKKIVKVYAVRILRKTFKPSTKQPIFEVFDFDDVFR